MASVFATTTEGEEAVAAATAETLVRVGGSTAVKGKIIEWGVATDGVSATAEPIRVRLVRCSSDGTGSAATETQVSDPDNPTANCVGTHSFSAEPTKTDVIIETELHPQGDRIQHQFPLGREPGLDSATTSCIGIEVVAPAVVNLVAYIMWEE